jgi:hypothetical protein
VTVVLLQPHYDDAVLFATYTLLIAKPHVVTVLGGETTQAPVVFGEERQRENHCALDLLKVTSTEDWTHHDELDVDWEAVLADMRDLNLRLRPNLVWTPLDEQDGHEHHNLVSAMAVTAFGPERLRYYTTYRRGNGRTVTDYEVIPLADWYALKFKAMACYESQINLPLTRPWFENWSREWEG